MLKPFRLFAWQILVLTITLGGSNGLFGEEPANPTQLPVLHLANGDHVTGQLVNSPLAESIGWQSPSFAAPFQFMLSNVTSIHLPTSGKLPIPEGEYCFELAGGDMLFGSLLKIDADEALLDVPKLGKMTLNRSIIQRIYRLSGKGDQIFIGPSGMNGWTTAGVAESWREDAGQLITSTSGAILKRDFGIPDQARFEFELSWSSAPDFELAIGVGKDVKTAMRAYRFEVWQNEIVVQRETEREADVTSVQRVVGTNGRLHLQAFLDQKAGRMLVYSSSGEPLADLTVATSKPQTFGGIQLTNRNGEVRLERLRIGRWNGEIPQDLKLDKSRLHRGDGTIHNGVLKSYDAGQHEFVIREGDVETRIPEDQVHDIFLSKPESVAPRGLRMVALNGMRISGDLVSVENQQVTLKSPEIRELLIVSMNELQSVIALKTKQDPAELPQRQGRLEFTGGSLHGCLIDAQEGESSCLVWQPQSSATSSPLHRGVSGRIVYREAVPVATNPTGIQRVQARVRVQRAGGVIGQIQGAMETGKTNRKSKILTLHLKTGDTLPCSAASIDEQGVRFESANSDATFVPHSQIKVLELLSDASPVQIPPEKKERLLTLPRMQRDNPPTHLIRSVDGDYLRGRLLSMDDEQIKIELRLEEKIVRRDRVARIIWLHPELQDANKKPLEEASDLSRQIQAVPSNGHRLTFVPEQLAGSILSGKSDLLGICRVDLLQTDVVMIGASIELAAAELAFHQWKLKSAADPLATPSGGEATGDGGEGQESALVGKQAPEIELNLVEGGRFKLSEHKQKIVILDFWASWCGPCLQVMPQIDRVVHEFAEQGVELIAINLEETPEQVKAALARLSLSTTVALDRDGRVAERYGATSIPQTVIIDREGKVARLFVGGGARFDEQLRTALKTVIGATPQPVE